MSPLVSVFYCLLLWQMYQSITVLSECSLNNDDVLVSSEFRVNYSVAVAVSALEIDLSIEECAEMCCENEACNALEFQDGSDSQPSSCMQYACNDVMDCHGTVDRESGVIVALWLEKKESNAVTAAHLSSSEAETSISTSSTQLSLSSELQTTDTTTVTDWVRATDQARPSDEEAIVDGIVSEAKTYAISEIGGETPSDSKIVLLTENVQSNTDDDFFRKLVGDRLADEVAQKPRSVWSNISVGALAVGMVVFGLSLLLIAIQLHRAKERTRYMSLP